ncbi:glycosyltransferase family 2 protein [Lichenifustis flavocetrariae]|uniref:Glycosyltransferase n=1 Tax=Lichenifustis flavocetrariae TaxID=2949735 RepID=A0AA41YZU0_9HYPH|nr:glycosyltransferase family 2 protein [Lichenifustis flavocetrariae]MCW6511594.1 glycosyltransferase [Lichenifustis flavocetrariae]
MPMFNAARTVTRAIDSVVAQTHGDWELICVDDGSTDGTIELAAAYAPQLGNRILTERLDRNGGPARARNHGLARATGTWVAVLDADDAWRPDRLHMLLTTAAPSGADAVCDNLIGFDDHHGRETVPLFQSLPARLDLPTAVAAEYQGRYNLGYLKPVVRRAFLDQRKIRYDESLRTGEDLLLLLDILAAGGSVACSSRATYIYTTPVGEGSRKLSRSTNTAPRDADLARALERFAERHRMRLSDHDRQALSRRTGYLAAIASISHFRHARLTRDWPTVLRLFIERPEIRRHVWLFLRPKRPSFFQTH